MIANKLLRKTLLFYFLVLCLNVSGQNNYIDFCLKVFQANKLLYENKPDSSIAIYKQAFKLVDYINFQSLNNALIAAKKVNDDSLIAYTTEKLNEYLQGDFINKRYQSIIDSLSIEDQRVRSDKYVDAMTIYKKYNRDTLLSKSNKEYIEAKFLVNEFTMVDSSNIITLLNLISAYGFPGERRVGNESYKHAFYILLHFDSDKDNSILKPIISKALNEGDMEPNDYGWIIDRRLCWGQKMNPYYYVMPMGLDTLSASEIDKVNERRKSIGLRNLYEGVEIIRSENNIEVKILY